MDFRFLGAEKTSEVDECSPRSSTHPHIQLIQFNINVAVLLEITNGCKRLKARIYLFIYSEEKEQAQKATIRIELQYEKITLTIFDTSTLSTVRHGPFYFFFFIFIVSYYFLFSII